MRGNPTPNPPPRSPRPQCGWRPVLVLTTQPVWGPMTLAVSARRAREAQRSAGTALSSSSQTYGSTPALMSASSAYERFERLKKPPRPHLTPSPWRGTAIAHERPAMKFGVVQVYTHFADLEQSYHCGSFLSLVKKDSPAEFRYI